ncbi:hypothetical protein, partial [Streptomyces sp. DH7]|uniref:hypothetical protein n=1 Tax=Streptomyces sp. DH7 TaxID=2857006 RepID=UPI001E4F2BA6
MAISYGQTPVGVASTTGVVRFTDSGLLIANLERAHAPAQPGHQPSLLVEFAQLTGQFETWPGKKG